MLLQVNDMKENAVRCLRRFCALDMIIIDGDATILPWSSEARQLLRFVNQVGDAVRACTRICCEGTHSDML